MSAANMSVLPPFHCARSSIVVSSRSSQRRIDAGFSVDVGDGQYLPSTHRASWCGKDATGPGHRSVRSARANGRHRRAWSMPGPRPARDRASASRSSRPPGEGRGSAAWLPRRPPSPCWRPAGAPPVADSHRWDRPRRRSDAVQAQLGATSSGRGLRLPTGTHHEDHGPADAGGGVGDRERRQRARQTVERGPLLIGEEQVGDAEVGQPARRSSIRAGPSGECRPRPAS